MIATRWLEILMKTSRRYLEGQYYNLNSTDKTKNNSSIK